MSPYNTFIAKSRYSRYLDNKGRREHWNETVARYFDFMTEHLQKKQKYTLSPELRKELETAVVNLERLCRIPIVKLNANPSTISSHLNVRTGLVIQQGHKAFNDVRLLAF